MIDFAAETDPEVLWEKYLNPEMSGVVTTAGEVTLAGQELVAPKLRWTLTNLLTDDLHDKKHFGEEGEDFLYTLDPEFKARWLEDLRSGKYAQGHGQLCDAQRRRCCLGVAFDSVQAVRDDVTVEESPMYGVQEEVDGRVKIFEGYKLEVQTAVKIDNSGTVEVQHSEPADRVASNRLIELTGITGSSGLLNHRVFIQYLDSRGNPLKEDGPDGWYSTSDWAMLSTLAELNDAGIPFEVIARIIEVDFPTN